MSKYHDDDSYASDPGDVGLVTAKLERWWPAREHFSWFSRLLGFHRDFYELLDEHLKLGDSRAAIVVTVKPLVVAAYTDEVDCIVLLKFPAELAQEYSLKPSQRLLTVNTYGQGDEMAPDLKPGEENLGNYTNYFPLIAEFLSDDVDKIEGRRTEIDESEWVRCTALGRAALERGDRPRDGSPYRSADPA